MRGIMCIVDVLMAKYAEARLTWLQLLYTVVVLGTFNVLLGFWTAPQCEWVRSMFPADRRH